ncbi:MAG: adenosine-specific kinase [candidate division Zixibacteria bacterium]|nr:adenosine-specific kinase [candidate division Zixibacteria bacterium]
MKTKQYKIEIEPDENLILGMSHFIKTVEDIYEIMVNSSPSIKFGIAFCEASGPCLVRSDGNDADLIVKAEKYAYDIGAGHSFIIIMKDGFPINVLPALKACREVCRIFCATSNPVEVLIAETAQGRGIMGVVDGFIPKGIETDEDKKTRVEFLRKIGYKRGG